MTLKKKVLAIILAVLLVIFGAWAVYRFDSRPTVETRSTVYIVPWPWELEWDGIEIWKA